MSDEPKPPRVHYYDPAERAREKQASRDEDARRLAAGEVTREELAQENGLFHGWKFRINWSEMGLPSFRKK